MWSYILTIPQATGTAAYTLGDPTGSDGRRVGYEAPAMGGVLSMNFANVAEWPAEPLTADVEIINGQVLEEIDLPGEVPVPWPVRVTVRALVPLAAPVQVFLQLRIGAAMQTGGMRRSRPLPADQAPVPVPTWARDVSGTLVPGNALELAPASGVFAGELIAPTDAPVALPTWTRFVRQAGTSPLAWVTFFGGRG
jgi:hypothetical protein